MALTHPDGEDRHIVEAHDDRGVEVMEYLEKEKLDYTVGE